MGRREGRIWCRRIEVDGVGNGLYMYFSYRQGFLGHVQRGIFGRRLKRHFAFNDEKAYLTYLLPSSS